MREWVIAKNSAPPLSVSDMRVLIRDDSVGAVSRKLSVNLEFRDREPKRSAFCLFTGSFSKPSCLAKSDRSTMLENFSEKFKKIVQSELRLEIAHLDKAHIVWCLPPDIEVYDKADKVRRMKF
jgi:hypothetical protein